MNDSLECLWWSRHFCGLLCIALKRARSSAFAARSGAGFDCVLCQQECLSVMPYYPLGDARRFVRSFTLDCHRKYKLDCIAEIFEGSKRKSSAYPRTCTDGRNKPNSIQSVVDCALPRLFKLHRVLHQRTEQRKRQEAVRDRRAVRGFFFGAFTI